MPGQRLIILTAAVPEMLGQVIPFSECRPRPCPWADFSYSFKRTEKKEVTMDWALRKSKWLKDKAATS